MTRFFTLLANVFFPIRYLLAFICFASLFLIIYLLVFAPLELQSLYLTACLLSFLWCLVLFVLCHSFHGEVASKNSSTAESKPKLGFFRRIKKKLSKIFLWIYSVAFLALIIVSLHLTIKVLTL
ncbi:hypothetical protein Q4493_08250 [Colwellia sp. 1_MG-2023]|uniref:hypothetical protein n=1 Tax=Colwellia sp. 1_MG-2023 TaxID=3062649 RepID=UPI0026E27D40|nr:hypothetical protein [Colwellia sp. 1_MG-2023]MDO6445761.1 hypothetical protein [Colwellia sp. 1_MG-2023]